MLTPHDILPPEIDHAASLNALRDALERKRKTLAERAEACANGTATQQYYATEGFDEHNYRQALEEVEFAHSVLGYLCNLAESLDIDYTGGMYILHNQYVRLYAAEMQALVHSEAIHYAVTQTPEYNNYSYSTQENLNILDHFVQLCKTQLLPNIEVEGALYERENIRPLTPVPGFSTS